MTQLLKLILLDEISAYFKNIKAYYGEELIEMYTKEDFFRDYPPQKEHFLFPWEKAYIENEVKRITEEQTILAKKNEMLAEKQAIIIRRTEEKLMIEQKRAQAAQEREQAEQKRAEEERQKAEKLANVLAKLGISAEEAMKM